MKWVPQDSRSLAPLYVGGALIAGFAAAFAWTRLNLPTPSCKFRDLSGFPCATCGTTRMIEALTHGHFVSALGHNPLLFAVLVGVGIWIVVSIVGAMRGIHRKLIFESGDARKLWILLGVAALLNWAYLIYIDQS